MQNHLKRLAPRPLTLRPFSTVAKVEPQLATGFDRLTIHYVRRYIFNRIQMQRKAMKEIIKESEDSIIYAQ